MDIGSISPEEFRKLQMQVDILQRFLTKTFGSSFLDFCKETKLSLMTKGSTSTTKALPGLNKALSQISNGGTGGATPNGKNVKVEVVEGTGNGTNGPTPSTSSGGGGARRPPPLLHRPNGSAIKGGGGNNVLTISATGRTTPTRVTNNISTSTAIAKNTPVLAQDEEEEEVEEAQIEFYDDEGDGNEEDVVQFIQPETVFSDDEQSSSQCQSPKKSVTVTSIRNGGGATKREHSVAFGYDDLDNANDDKMQLPEGTECIVIDSDEDQGQQENFSFQQDDDDEMYNNGVANNDEEYYEDEGYSYNMVEDGLEVSGNGTGNYATEELHTDGNVTFGTVITAQDTGIQYFQCSFCPSAKVFKHKQSLKEHYLLNHSPTPPAYQCQCGRRFLKQSQLKRHEVVHTAERPFVCPICFKDFTRKDNMSVHLVRNHAEKKHPCPYCPDKIYATTAEVNRHLRMYHSQWQQ